MGKILVATDFFVRSDRALRRAVLEAGRLEADIRLVHAIDDGQPAYMIERQREVAQQLLGDAVRTFTEVDNAKADMDVRTGDAFVAVLEVAEDIDADMIFGSTAQRTPGSSSRPVLVANSMPSGPVGASCSPSTGTRHRGKRRWSPRGQEFSSRHG